MQQQAIKVPRETVRYLTLHDWEFVARVVMGMEIEWFHRRNAKISIENQVSLILGPRGSGKTETWTVPSVVQDLCRSVEVAENYRYTQPPEGWPPADLAVYVGSKTHCLAISITRAIRGVLENSTMLQEAFGDFVGSKWTDGAFTIAQRPSFTTRREHSVMAFGVGGGATGYHFDRFKIDDPVDRINSKTKHQRAELREWATHTLGGMQQPHSWTDYAGTRYHPDDLWQHLLDTLKIPRHVYRAIYVDAEGEKHSLWPAFMPLEDEIRAFDNRKVQGLLHKQRDMNGLSHGSFEAQFQQDVALMQSRIIDPDRILGHRLAEVDMGGLRILQSVDFAFGLKEQDDFSVIATLGYHPEQNRIYILWVTRGRWSSGELIAVLKSEYDRWRPREVLGEENNLQKAEVKPIMEATAHLPWVRLVPDADKMIRSIPLRLEIDRKQLFVDKDSEWWETCKSEMHGFPGGDHDDIIDALSMGVHRLRGSRPIVLPKMRIVEPRHKQIFRDMGGLRWEDRGRVPDRDYKRDRTRPGKGIFDV